MQMSLSINITEVFYRQVAMATCVIKFSQCASGQKSAFSPLQEKLCVVSKNNFHLLELSRRSLSACKVWGRSNYACRLQERKLVFFVCHTWSACAWWTQLKQVLCDDLLVDFGAVFNFFSERIVLSDALHSSHFCRQVAPQFLRNCGQKVRKVQKSTEKLCAPLRIDS